MTYFPDARHGTSGSALDGALAASGDAVCCGGATANQEDVGPAANSGAMSAVAAQVRDVKFPIIDYRTHPAFAPLVGPNIYDDELIGSAVERIDAIHGKFVSSGSPVKADAERAVTEISEL